MSKKKQVPGKSRFAKEKLSDWLYYHRLHLITAAVLLWIGGSMLFTVWWPLVVLFEQSAAQQIRNAFLFSVLHFWRVLLCAGIQLL